eukprot:scaffold38624_cov39-Phaeocystis_antarctica.AAC.2
MCQCAKRPVYRCARRPVCPPGVPAWCARRVCQEEALLRGSTSASEGQGRFSSSGARLDALRRQEAQAGTGALGRRWQVASAHGQRQLDLI